MQPIFQSILLWLAFDEFLYGFQLVCTARLKSTGVVENIAIVIHEDEFVVDIVLATLQGFSWLAVINNNKLAEPLL